MAKMYVLRTRHPDGTWTFDMENKMSKREANRLAQFGRTLGGIYSSVWPEDEALDALAKSPTPTDNSGGGV